MGPQQLSPPPHPALRLAPTVPSTHVPRVKRSLTQFCPQVSPARAEMQKLPRARTFKAPQLGEKGGFQEKSQEGGGPLQQTEYGNRAQEIRAWIPAWPPKGLRRPGSKYLLFQASILTLWKKKKEIITILSHKPKVGQGVYSHKQKPPWLSASVALSVTILLGLSGLYKADTTVGTV